MSILSSVLKIFKAIWQKIWKAIKYILKNFWWLIAIVAIIYFAPMLVAASGTPSWLVSILQVIPSSWSTAVASALSWVWSAVSGIGGAVWEAYRSLGLGTQLAIAGGTMALLAPEETEELITEVTDVVTDVIGDVVGTVADVVTSSPVFIIGLGLLGAWLLFGGSRDDEKRVTLDVQSPTQPPSEELVNE